MTRFGWFAGLVLVAFWIVGLSAFLMGGMAWVGYVFQVFLVTVAVWICRELYREYSECVRTEYSRTQVFREWDRRQNSHLKGMD